MNDNNKTLDLLFRNAHTHNVFTDRPVSDETLREIHQLMKWAPTSANSQPMRVVFVRSAAAKEKLAPALSDANREKTLKAPVTAILAYDTRFYEHLPRTFHNPDAINWFRGDEKKAVAETTAFRNGTLQGGYFIIAARALGLDTGPMSGFDNSGVDKEFFPDGRVKTNFICSVGYGDPAGLFPRSPRFVFDEVAKIL
jgi:3-hydroxypropanoate dehydrogenase